MIRLYECICRADTLPVPTNLFVGVGETITHLYKYIYRGGHVNRPYKSIFSCEK